MPADTAQKGPATPAPTIIVTAPQSETERRIELREFTKEIMRPPRPRHPIARFLHPVCPQVLGLDPADAEAIAERIRENARALGIGADADADCTPTIKVAFMAPAAGAPDTWLDPNSPTLRHLALYQRERVLAEAGPVRAWNKVVIRDSEGQPLALLEKQGRVMVPGEFPQIDPMSRGDPITTAEITGAAVMIARDAAEGLTLAQLADYATMRALVDTSTPERDRPAPAPTILTLFSDTDPAKGLTTFDRSLIAGLYNAPRNSSARRVYNDIAIAAVRSEAADQIGEW